MKNTLRKDENGKIITTYEYRVLDKRVKTEIEMAKRQHLIKRSKRGSKGYWAQIKRLQGKINKTTTHEFAYFNGSKYSEKDAEKKLTIFTTLYKVYKHLQSFQTFTMFTKISGLKFSFLLQLASNSYNFNLSSLIFFFCLIIS